MRRPDQFIALTNNKIDILCQGLSIAKFKNSDFLSYWQDVIGTLRTFAWWNQPEPIVDNNDASACAIENREVSEESTEKAFTENREHTLWKNRAVLIDLFLFADVDFAENSNYIRARDKALNRTVTSAKPMLKKRTKETAESIVDKALAADDLPEYLQGKRDSLINQVKAGKSVEQAIGLIRAIFG